MAISLEPKVVDEFPTREHAAGAGRQRDPNPFEVHVLNSYETGNPLAWTAKQLASTGLEMKKILELVRRAATYNEIGVDTYVDKTGTLTIQAREKREVHRKPKNQS